MQPTDKIIAHAYLSSQSLPQDFVEEFIDAIERDLAENDERARTYLAEILTSAKRFPQAGLIGEVITTAFAIKELQERQGRLSKEIERINYLGQLIETETPNGDLLSNRIAYRKIAKAVEQITSETLLTDVGKETTILDKEIQS